MSIRRVVDEFKAFALRGNVLDFVMAVVIGGAIGRIITACVDGLVMPTFAHWLRETRWENWTYWQWRIGPVLSAVLDFIAKTAVMYLLLIKGVGALMQAPAGGDSSRACPLCREAVHPEALRCKHCGGDLAQPVSSRIP